MATVMATVMAMEMKVKSTGLTLRTISIFALCAVSGGSSFAQQNLPGGLPNSTTTSTGANQQTGRPAEDVGNTDGAPSRSWTIKPRISLTETFTDNVSINRNANGKRSDFITEITPGIRIEANANRLKGHFDYALRGQYYAKTDYSRTQNSLNTFGSFEAIEDWFFIDFSGVISQQSISAFGPQSPGNTTLNNNSTETSTYRISPYIRGQLLGSADYLLRYNASTTHSDTTRAYDLELTQWIGQLKGNTVFRNLSWTIDANQQIADYNPGRRTEADSARAMLTYAINPQFRVSISGGQESNNYASLNKETNDTYGYGFDLNPTERTRFSAFKERRFFGDGHRVTFSHRFPMSSISFSDTRDVSLLPNQFATYGMGTVYDQFYPQFSQICADRLPGNADQVLIDNCVLGLFQLLGIQPNTQVTAGYMTSRATIQRRQQLSFALFGARNTLTLLANRNENQSVLAASAIGGMVDDFAQNSTVRQQGVSLTYLHRLSPLSNLSVTASRQESTSIRTESLKTTTTLYQVNLSTKLGHKTTGMLNFRHAEFDSTANPYTENAVIGTITYIY